MHGETEGEERIEAGNLCKKVIKECSIEAGNKSEDLEYLKKFNRFLITHISMYKTVSTYGDFIHDRKNESCDGSNKHTFVGVDDEEFHNVVCKIGGGATSEVFYLK